VEGIVCVLVPPGTDQKELERLALASEKVKSFLDNKPPRRIIAIPGKLVNIVV